MIKKILYSTVFILTFNLSSAQCSDVLVNGHFDVSPDTGWTETLANPTADIAAVSAQPFGAIQRSGADAIIFSHAWASQTQTIDLVARGYSTTGLDAAPQIDISEWYLGVSSNTADTYYYLAELLDASDAVIDSYALGSEASPIISSAAWQEASHTFTGYGSGLRKIRVTHGGKDAEGWAGNYGVAIDDSSVCVNDSALSVDKNTLLSSNISVYPNPSNGRVTVSLKNNNFDNASISIYSLTGQKIYQTKNIISQMHEFDLDVASGVYQIEIINKARRSYKKLAIK